MKLRKRATWPWVAIQLHTFIRSQLVRSGKLEKNGQNRLLQLSELLHYHFTYSPISSLQRSLYKTWSTIIFHAKLTVHTTLYGSAAPYKRPVLFESTDRQDHISNHRGRHLLPKNWGLILKFTLPKFQRSGHFPWFETSIIKYAYFYFMIFGRIWVTHVSGMTLSILLYRILKVHFICNLLHSST